MPFLPATPMPYSFGLQRELWPQSVLSVEYVGTTASHQSIDRNINQPLMDNPERGKVSSPDLIRPYPGFSGISYNENSVSSSYNSLQVNLRINNYHGLSFQTAYTWSHAIDIAGTGEFAGVINAYNVRADRGNSDYDRRHMLLMNYVYNLPFFGSRSVLLKTTLG